MELSIAAVDWRGVQFIGFDSFEEFKTSPAQKAGEVFLTSPEIVTSIRWDQLVGSWNVVVPEDGYLRIEARAICAGHATRFYTLGLWSGAPDRHPRQSVPKQDDADGKVLTDTLVLKEPCDRVQLRVLLGADSGRKPELKFLGLCLLDSQVKPAVLPANRQAWGRLLPVPERSQMAYPGGIEWCSPATLSMLLGYWSNRLNRPELNREVPEIVKGVFDPQWPGTGNWPFNTAYAGSLTGIRAYVTRFTDVSEIEDWIACGIPVGLSVCYNRLRAKSDEPSGHLVVCVGFTGEGDVIVNDPGTRRNVRKTFPRKDLIRAWAYSRNTVYLVYPEHMKKPKDRFGHWDSLHADSVH